MIGQHFKEIIETICISKHVSKAYICREIGITKPTLNKFEREGLPLKDFHIIYRIRKFAAY